MVAKTDAFNDLSFNLPVGTVQEYHQLVKIAFTEIALEAIAKFQASENTLETYRAKQCSPERETGAYDFKKIFPTLYHETVDYLKILYGKLSLKDRHELATLISGSDEQKHDNISRLLAPYDFKLHDFIVEFLEKMIKECHTLAEQNQIETLRIVKEYEKNIKTLQFRRELSDKVLAYLKQLEYQRVTYIYKNTLGRLEEAWIPPIEKIDEIKYRYTLECMEATVEIKAEIYKNQQMLEQLQWGFEDESQQNIEEQIHNLEVKKKKIEDQFNINCQKAILEYKSKMPPKHS